MANEDKATRYHRLRRRASVASALASGSFLLLMLVTGASSALRDAVTAWVGPADPGVAATFVVMLALLHEAVQLPVVYYRGLTLDRRYGLSTQTERHWWRDHAKSAALGTALLVGAGVMVSTLLKWSPSHWWVTAAAVGTAAFVLLVRATPTLLLPMFYDLRPLDRPELTRRLVALADRCGTRVLGVFEWRVSDQTRKASAALVGIGRTRRILVSDTLLADHTDDEVEVILAHELAHHVHWDIWSALGLQAGLMLAACYLADQALLAFAGPLGLQGKADVAGLPLVALAGGVVPLALAPLTNAVSRAHERRADRFAIAITRNAAALVTALRRLGATNLAEERPSRVVEALFHTHPSLASRIDAARRGMGGSA